MSAALQTWCLVAIAGAAGTLLRYSMGGWLARVTGGVFPWETLTINALGSLAIGAIAGALDRGALLPPPWRMALMVGFLGGFTTFSSFALETFRLAEAAQWSSAAGYVLLTNVIGLGAAWAGYRVIA
jgi:fluoride exporter